MGFFFRKRSYFPLVLTDVVKIKLYCSLKLIDFFMCCFSCTQVKSNQQVIQIFAYFFFVCVNSLTWTLCRHRPLTVQQLPANPAAPCNRSPVKCLLRCTVCIFNRNSNPLTFLQLNFQAPKPTLTPKPMRIRTGLSINLPRSWTRPALKSSGWLEQVSFCLRLSALAVWVTSLSHISNWQPNIYTLSRDTACMLRVLIVQLRRGREGRGGGGRVHRN